ncbi:MAG: hypothetical protein Q4G19_00725 [Clostridia bacterium]|nr:hypothetical protein [Clostridia bacterium]
MNRKVILHPQSGPIRFQRGNTTFSFHESGAYHRFSAGEDLISSVITTCADGAPGGIVLRLRDESGVTEVLPLTGRGSRYRLYQSETGLRYASEWGKLKADVFFVPAAEGAWLWRVRVRGCSRPFDLLYMQDIGVCTAGMQRTNELYAAQYLAHHPLKGTHGYVIASRQNQFQGDRKPCLWQGMLEGSAARYSTDAEQYFGFAFRGGADPKAWHEDLESRVLQGESACIALQTAAVRSDDARFVFFGLYQADHPQTVSPSELPDLSVFGAVPDPEGAEAGQWREIPVPRPAFTAPYVSPEISEEEIGRRYPERLLEERDPEGHLLSFFLPDHSHVVLQRKEYLCSRSHANILTTLFDTEHIPDDLLTSTVCMNGDLACQTVVGNTSFHKLTSVDRCSFDLLPFSGTRLLIGRNGKWQALGLPACFEMNFHAARWLYLMPDDRLIVQVWMAAKSPAMRVSVHSEKGLTYRFALTMQCVLGEHEHDHAIRAERRGGVIRLAPGPDTMCAYPDLCYSIIPDRLFDLHRDDFLFEDGKARNDTLLGIVAAPGPGLSVDITADLYGKAQPAARSVDAEGTAYRQAYSDFLGGLSLRIPSDPETAARLECTAGWYLHNAMVHYCVPHGLEQTGGAAWGTRDVCQGPFELFLATKHIKLAGETLLAVFAHQHRGGLWPQWFMFDRYRSVYDAGSHGDVIFWPLKCLGDWLAAGGDPAILSTPAAWLEASEAPCALSVHVEAALTNIENSFIPGTDMLCYGEGDWDDTLQPADPSLRERLSSSWTQALACQVMARLSETLPSPLAERVSALKTRLAAGYARMVPDGIPAGFCLIEEGGRVTPMIHPLDTRTGIRYRLLPLTRSIIAGLASGEQAERQLRVIRENLLAPDGVHLLSSPTRYTGGNSVIFRRSELAANIGREVGLQYVHAHIRYIEALAAMDRGGEAWDALLRITPPLLERSVPNACPRQSNVYFSSSDACVADRAEFSARYGDILRGGIPVRGGWRLYSSGPGIWLARLLKDLLRIDRDRPLLPEGIPDLEYDCFDRSFRGEDRPR